MIHDRLRKVRRSLTIWSAEIADDVTSSVRSFPNVAAVNVVSKMKLPAWAVLQKQLGYTAPVDVIGSVTASPFLTNVVGGDDVAEVRKRRRQ